MTTYWICLRWNHATIGPPECPCCQDHVRIDLNDPDHDVDAELRVWWRLRMAQKPPALQADIASAGWGLYGPGWDRTVAALVEGARRRSTGFYVLSREYEDVYYGFVR